jgi:hypothetical protein
MRPPDDMSGLLQATNGKCHPEGIEHTRIKDL